MKLNIEAHQNNYREGYVNIACKPDREGILPVSFADLNQIAKDGEIEEIVANFVLQKIDHNHLPHIIAHWNKKLKKFAILHLSFFDVRQVAREAYVGSFNLEQIHNAILGINNENLCVIDMETVRKIMPDLGFRIASITPKDTIVSMELMKVAEVELENA